MSRTSGKSHRRKTGKPRAPAPAQTSDLSIYIGLIIIGLAIVVFGFLTFDLWKEITLGYLIVMALLINFYASAAYRGLSMAAWQQALARLPLRCAGFGSRQGKPLAAAHGAPKARNTILISIVISLAVIIGLALLLIPEVLGR